MMLKSVVSLTMITSVHLLLGCPEIRAMLYYDLWLLVCHVCCSNCLQHEDFKPYPLQPPAPPPASASATSVQQPMPDDYKNFDIVRAAQYGVLERCIELIDGGCDVNQPDAENVSVLHWAAINNRLEIVRYGTVVYWFC